MPVTQGQVNEWIQVALNTALSSNRIQVDPTNPFCMRQRTALIEHFVGSTPGLINFYNSNARLEEHRKARKHVKKNARRFFHSYIEQRTNGNSQAYDCHADPVTPATLQIAWTQYTNSFKESKKVKPHGGRRARHTKPSYV